MVSLADIPDEGSITPAEATARLAARPDTVIVDTRVVEPGQQPYTQHYPEALRIPLTELEHRVDEIPGGKPVIVHCVKGGKAAKAYSLLREKRPDIADICFIKGIPEYKK